MRAFALVLSVSVLTGTVLWAGDDPVSTENVSLTDGTLEEGWVVSVPSGSFDFVNARHDGLSGRPVMGISVGVADFGGGASYPLVGLYDANLALDPTGDTPDFASGISAGPLPGGGAYLDYAYVSLGGPYYPVSEPQHVVVQLPPGDPGTLGIGLDRTGPLGGFSGWTSDGYVTLSSRLDMDLGLNVNVDVITELQGQGEALLRTHPVAGDETGDYVTVTTYTGDDVGFAFFGPAPGMLWMLFMWSPPRRITAGLPTLSDGQGSYARVGTVWPPGMGGYTFTFYGCAGVPGVIGSLVLMNDVTISTLPDPPTDWGVCDDGTYEEGWTVHLPSGPSDFFSVNFRNPYGKTPNMINDMRLAVMDFGTTVTAYPLSGVFPANYSVDPSGNTPDLSSPYEAAPFTFPPGIMSTTSGQLVVRTLAAPIPYGTVLTDDVHGVIQFPPGDKEWLTVGADRDSLPCASHWSDDAFTTPAHFFREANWGIRLGGN
ncbi:MAG: hypothetical protein AB1486_29670 [Planctomycetota bacterium]